MPLHGFATGWTHITGTPGGGVLFYNASTGEATATIDGNGSYTFVGPLHGFAQRAGHTSPPPATSCSSTTCSTGEGATATLDINGNYRFVGLPSTDFHDGVDSIIGTGVFNGGGQLLFDATRDR